jgi:hypothetical protein
MKNFILGFCLTGVFISFSFLENKKEHDNDLKTIVITDTVRIFQQNTAPIFNISAIAGSVDKIKKRLPTAVQKIAAVNAGAKDKRVYNFEPLNTLNFQIDHWNESELRKDMYHHQFRNLDGLDLNTLKEVRMAFYYDKLLWDVHERTGLGIGVVWAFLRIEAFSPKINESRLLRTAWNFGGVKYNKKVHKDFVYSEDDCYNKNGVEIQCKFAKFNSYEEGMEAWAAVFNRPRYKNCKSQKSTFDIFNCIYKGGYHTHNNVKTRKQLCERYWTLTTHFPLNPSI